MNKKSVEDIEVAGKKVLLRCDLNAPLDENGVVTDETRIQESVPTIKYLVNHKAKVILCSHLGRPKGQVNEKYSLKPIVKRLSELLGFPVKLSKDVLGPDTKKLVSELKDGEVVLLENLRFDKGEEANDPAFAKELASLAEIYVNDAFGTAHRKHASTSGVAEYLPAVAGLLLQKEITFMGKALENPEKPFVAIIGGAKVSDKMGVIANLFPKVNTIIIGGGMAYTFLKAKGGKIGNSLLEEEKLPLAGEQLFRAKFKKINLLLPVDTVCTQEFKEDAEAKVFPSNDIPDGWMGMDIGPETRKLFAEALEGAQTVVWNGPMGVFEFPAFAEGTKAVARAVAECGATTIVGGGDSVAAIDQLGFADKITHVSTGGGAALEFLEGKELPGVVCLQDRE